MTKAEPQSGDLGGPVAGRQAPARGTRAFAGLGLFSGLGAVAAKSCCVLPLLLASSGLGGAWISQELVAYRPFLIGVAWTAVAAAWLIAIRRGRAACTPAGACAGRAKGQGLALLAFSSLIVGLATAWGWIEPGLVQVIFEAGL